MKKAILIVIALVVVALGVVIARNRPTADQEAVVYRQALMTVIGVTMDPLLLMQRGQKRYDAALIGKHAGELVVLSEMIPEAFARDTRSARNVETAALPSVWEKPRISCTARSGSRAMPTHCRARSKVAIRRRSTARSACWMADVRSVIVVFARTDPQAACQFGVTVPFRTHRLHPPTGAVARDKAIMAE